MKNVKMGLLSFGLAYAALLPATVSAKETNSEVVPFEKLCDAESRPYLKLCNFLENADEVIGFEETVSLTGDPNSYVVLARYDDDWSIYARGVFRHPSQDVEGSWTTETRAVTRRISTEMMAKFYASQAWRGDKEQESKPAQRPKICLDGASFTIGIKGSDLQTGSDPKIVARRFFCSSKAGFNEMKLDLQKLAVEKDPEMAKFFPSAVRNLTGLGRGD